MIFVVLFLLYPEVFTTHEKEQFHNIFKDTIFIYINLYQQHFISLQK